ncbi:MAG: hypothetical protein O2865_17395 [Planctomycetota bacterium]|nr:hypothetical protein [Planctomycetota bacterium]
MSSPIPHAQPTALPGVVLRAAAPGLLLAGTGAALGLAGTFDAGAAAAATIGGAVAWGAVAAAATGLFGVLLKSRAVLATQPSGSEVSEAIRARVEGQRFQIALFGDFLIQLVVLGAGIVALRSGGIESDGTAGTSRMMGFGLSFATVALFHQVGAALVLSAVLRKRARSRAEASGQSVGIAPGVPAGDDRHETSSETSPSVAAQESTWVASTSGGRTIHAHR